MTKTEKMVVRAAMGWHRLKRHDSVDKCGYVEFLKLFNLRKACARHAAVKRKGKR